MEHYEVWTTSSASDTRLVEAALGGDKDAFAALVTRHWTTALLDDSGAGRREEWQDLPSGTAALAAEARGWVKRFAPAASPHVGPGGQAQVEE